MKNYPFYYILLYLYLSGSLQLTAQDILKSNGIKFHKLDMNYGLPSNITTSICQDKKGFIWIGTSNGLVRYDGMKSKVYQHNPSDSFSLPNNLIRTIFIDSNGIIWIGTSTGLVKYMLDQEKFINMQPGISKKIKTSYDFSELFLDSEQRLWIKNEAKEYLIFDTNTDTLISVLSFKTLSDKGWPEKGMELGIEDKDGFFWFLSEDKFCQVLLNGDKIHLKTWENNLKNDLAFSPRPTCISEDSQGNIYISNNGLFKLPYNKKSSYEFEYIDVFKGKNQGSQTDFDITSIVEDKESNIWIATKQGVVKYNPAIGMKYITLKPINYKGISDSWSFVYKDALDNIWVCYDNSVFYLYDFKNNTFTEFKHSPSDPFSPSPDIYTYGIFNVFIDSSKIFWIPTISYGVNTFSLQKSKFPLLKNLPENTNSLSANNIWGIYEDSHQSPWIGLSPGGLNIYDVENNKILDFSEVGGNITDIEQVSENEFWLGSVPVKCFSFDFNTKKLNFIGDFKPDYNDTTSISSWLVLDIFKDNSGDIWFGTSSGLDLYVKPSKLNAKGWFKHFTSAKNSRLILPNGWVWNIYEDRQNRLWVSTSGGLSCINAERTKATMFINDPGDSNSISSNNVKHTMQDNAGRLWIATEGGGLNRYIEEENRFIAYNKETNFPSDNIFAVYEDNSGNLWMSSTEGIIRFDPETLENYTFTTKDGLQSNQFKAGSFHKGKSGKIYFGGINGLNHFYPDSVKLSKFSPNIVFTSLKIYNDEAKVNKKYNGNIYLTKAISYTDKITLSYREKGFSLEYAALDFSASQNIKFAYQLEGVNIDWVETDANSRILNYVNLASGNYILKVKSTNADGVWCDNIKTLSINILPPFWETLWFKVLLLIILLSSIYIWILFRTRHLKRQKLALEEKVKERTLKIEKQKEELSIQAENLLETNILLKEHGEELEAFSEELKAQGEELYRANEELVKLNATKDRFYNIVAHELKNPENDTTLESANEQDRLFLEKIIKVIEENLSNPDFTLDHLAEKLHLSRSTLYRKIISVTEQHPKEIIKTIRFQHAGRLIKQGTKSISQVMYEVGLTDPSHFAKTFKNMFGVLPSKYKNDS